MFRVADHAYDVTCASLKLFSRIDEPSLCWGVKIIGKGRDDGDDMSSWEPAILADVLLETKLGRMSHWYDIAGTTVEWDEPKEDPQALFEVYETTAIYKCKWQFLAVPGNRKVRLVFDGMTDIDTDYQKIPIHLDTLLGVAPLPMARRPEKKCLADYRQLGLEDPVEFHSDQYGVSTLVFLNQ
jgi:hypothetical protein